MCPVGVVHILVSITLSLPQAGSWEECCFRAVPLSIAALIGRRFKCEKLSVAIMMLIQAVIFGAAHANYPSMPSWARYFDRCRSLASLSKMKVSRLAELILPSILFGCVYLQYGLLPSVVLHFVFDVVWFALPLFATPAIVDQSMVIILATAPLWLVIGKWALSPKASKVPELTAMCLVGYILSIVVGFAECGMASCYSSIPTA